MLIKIKIPDRHVKWVRSDSTFILYRPLIGSACIIVNTPNSKSLLYVEDALKDAIVNDIMMPLP